MATFDTEKVYFYTDTTPKDTSNRSFWVLFKPLESTPYAPHLIKAQGLSHAGDVFLTKESFSCGDSSALAREATTWEYKFFEESMKEGKSVKPVGVTFYKMKDFLIGEYGRKADWILNIAEHVPKDTPVEVWHSEQTKEYMVRTITFEEFMKL
jgi:hypothetical protein